MIPNTFESTREKFGTDKIIESYSYQFYPYAAISWNSNRTPFSSTGKITNTQFIRVTDLFPSPTPMHCCLNIRGTKYSVMIFGNKVLTNT